MMKNEHGGRRPSRLAEPVIGPRDFARARWLAPQGDGRKSVSGLSFLSPSGRLRPQPFLIAIVAVYIAGALSHWLTVPDVIARLGLWAFAAAQAVLTWLWFVLHAKRLHDAGRGEGLAIAVVLLYVLSLILLLLLATNFFAGSEAGSLGGSSATSALELVLLLYIVMTLAGPAQYDLTWIVVVILAMFAFVPVLVALLFTLWTATRTGSAKP
jgi:uncharacterized membrane protein YhaH (DUF805 family)